MSGRGRWEAERAEYLRDGARADTSRMRRADLLTRAAWRGQRGEAGLAGTEVHQEVPRRAWHRWTHGPGGERRRRGLLGFVLLVGAVLVGLGVALGWGIYRGLEWASPRIGRLWWWPWAVVAAVVVALRWWLTDWPILGVWLGVGRYFPGSFVGVGGWPGWLTLQVIAAAVTVAWLVHAWGWAAVPAGAVAPPAKNKDGSWRVTPDSQRIDFDVYGADQVYVPEPQQLPESAEEPSPDAWQHYWGLGDDGDEERAS